MIKQLISHPHWPSNIGIMDNVSYWWGQTSKETPWEGPFSSSHPRPCDRSSHVRPPW